LAWFYATNTLGGRPVPSMGMAAAHAPIPAVRYIVGIVLENAMPIAADPGRSRSRIGDDVAQHSDLM
jgi:hypothetical protein